MKNKFAIYCLLTLSILATSAYSNQLDELLPSERNTVEIFQKFSPKVVYVHRLTTVVNHTLERLHVPAGSGSGIVWDKEGHIVTNFHVVKGADLLTVTIGKMTVPAKVVGTEPRKDIAVLKLQSPEALKSLKDFEPFVLTHSKDLLVGQQAIAIGNPFGLDHTLTVGVISALGRQVPGVGGVTIPGMIQTDASINPGNSGGPLLDSKGRLIGLNSIIYSNSGSSAGIGFAIPSDEIERIVPQLAKNGRVILAGLGIQPVAPSIAHHLGVRSGVLVGEILPNSPAAKLHLHSTVRDNWGRITVGDVLVALNGHPVKDYDELYNLLTHINVGEKVTVTINRHCQKLNFSTTTIDIAAY